MPTNSTVPLALAFLLTATATAVVAQDDPIKERQELMKSNGKQMEVVVPMTREQQPFDAAAAQQALQTLHANAQALDADRLFPDGTQTGGETAALPAVWEDRAGFVDRIEKFRTSTAAAVETPPQDLAALREAVTSIGESCGGCHETYRAKKE